MTAEADMDVSRVLHDVISIEVAGLQQRRCPTSVSADGVAMIFLDLLPSLPWARRHQPERWFSSPAANIDNGR
jgi:hypothetical protein